MSVDEELEPSRAGLFPYVTAILVIVTDYLATSLLVSCIMYASNVSLRVDTFCNYYLQQNVFTVSFAIRPTHDHMRSMFKLKFKLILTWHSRLQLIFICTGVYISNFYFYVLASLSPTSIYLHLSLYLISSATSI